MSMTFEEYELIISNRLITAHNNADIAAVSATFRQADQTLERSSTTPADRKEFWEEVRKKVVDSDGLLFEKQSSSALVALIQAIEREIAARTANGK